MSQPSNVVAGSVEALVWKARLGDMDAFAAVFEGMRADVYKVAYRLVGADDANDIVMDAFLKAWQAIPRFVGRSSLRTWLYRITYNCAIDYLRSRQRRGEESLSSGSEESGVREVADETSGRPDEIVAGRELAEEMALALSLLPYEHKVTLELRYSDGLSYLEIASATGVSVGTVMSRLFNGKRKLRKLLEAESQK
jgi:RNA polymerase sigma-70 factor, ECF subfamily